MGVTFTVLVISKAGEARGERTFRVRLVRPNGKPVGDDAEFRALFQNERGELHLTGGDPDDGDGALLGSRCMSMERTSP